MGDILEYVSSLCPVTALCFLDVGENLLLAGEGAILKIFSVKKQALIATARIFRYQTIHGIICKESAEARKTLVIWGGFLVRIIHLTVNGRHIQIHSGPKLEAPGWVLDGQLRPPQASEAECQPLGAHVALVTARNALLLLEIPEDLHQSCLIVLSGSSYSILYSANIKWIAPDRILVASGTAFGEIIVWSCTLKPLPEPPSVRQHQILRGHEGSVFGVNISERLPSLGFDLDRRFLASCSDDRTIRVWDISAACSQEDVNLEQNNVLQLDPPETGFRAQPQETSEGQTPKDMLTMAWGHVSRIWGIRFFCHEPVSDGAGLGLLSFGEDATCQQWRLSWSCKIPESSSSCPPDRFALEHQGTKSSHTGRNIWSMAIAKSLLPGVPVATGGADGGIVCFTVTNPVSVLDTVSSRSLLEPSPVGSADRDQTSETQDKSPSHGSNPTVLGRGQDLCFVTDSKEETAVKVQNAGVLAAGSEEAPREFKFLRSYILLDERRILGITDAGSVLVISCRDTGKDSMTETVLGLDGSANISFHHKYMSTT
ncbi:MAG: hypothetical protein M1816_001616 [Peltula sp. TS41687]|nr:MAG: hypothetical protein M1816_001616 [Peltula sp. TS41687]